MDEENAGVKVRFCNDIPESGDEEFVEVIPDASAARSASVAPPPVRDTKKGSAFLPPLVPLFC